MNKEELKSKISNANAKYRSGESVMSDSEYDALVEEFRQRYPDEYDDFRDSLNEGAVEYGSKVKHPYIMGSLDKVTIEKPEDIKKFIRQHITDSMSVSAKVDGISCRLHYVNGKLVQASTRGNGTEGTDITDKIFFVKGIPVEIAQKDFDIRGELVIIKSDFASLEGFANPRNATAGIINRKDWKKKDISKVSFIAYTILGDEYPKGDQFSILKASGFNVAWNCIISADDCSKDDIIEKLSNFICLEHEYDTDGLVISDSMYRNEKKYRPDATVAVKGNMNAAVTRIIDVEWRGPSSNGKFVPVAQLEPVELCGTMVSQATMNNLDFIEKMHLNYGSIVKVQKRGEIIPAIVELVSNDDSASIDIPEFCPCCGSKLVKDGPFIWCKNKDCSDQTVKQLTLFIKKLGVKHASEATLKNFKIFSFEDLLNFVPNKKYKSEVKLYDELNEKVFTKSRKELLSATNFKDLSELLIGKIIDFYGFENIENGKYIGLPDGIGDITLSKFKEDILDNLRIVDMFIRDSRYNFIDNTECISRNAETIINGMSVCFTGKLDTMSRSDASKLAEKFGYAVKNAVSKGLTYLVTNDPDTNSSKGKNARKFGVKIISESEFIKMCDNAANDVMTL